MEIIYDVSNEIFKDQIHATEIETSLLAVPFKGLTPKSLCYTIPIMLFNCNTLFLS